MGSSKYIVGIIAFRSRVDELWKALGRTVGTHFCYADHLNSPRRIYDQSQQLVWAWEQGEPFGNDVPNNNPSGVGAFDFPLRFPGQYFDKETGLHQNARRDYGPSDGRYIESDPIGLKAGLNTYAYGRNNPLRWVDPNGLLVIDGSCSAADRVIIQTAEQKVKGAAQSCIPCQDRDKFLDNLEKASVSCIGTCKPPFFKGLQVDAYAQGGTSIVLTPCGINPQVGCVEATLVHEITHLIGYGDEKIPREYEKQCFACAPNRPPYP